MRVFHSLSQVNYMLLFHYHNNVSHSFQRMTRTHFQQTHNWVADKLFQHAIQKRKGLKIMWKNVIRLIFG